jgi:hypothetical protein
MGLELLFRVEDTHKSDTRRRDGKSTGHEEEESPTNRKSNLNRRRLDLLAFMDHVVKLCALQVASICPRRRN